MPSTINLQPDVLDLVLYAGDGVDLRMICTNEDGAPVDLTGAVTAQIRAERLSSDAPIVEFSVNTVDSFHGKIILSLTGEQTTQLALDPSSKSGKFVGVWDVQWTPAEAEPRTLCQGKVECYADVSR